MKNYIIVDIHSIVVIIRAENHKEAMTYCRENDIKPMYIREQAKL